MKRSEVICSLQMIAALVIVATIGSSCSIKKMALRQTASLFKTSMPAFERDEDVELVQASLPSMIKTLEALLENDPENEDLIALLAQAYTSYGMVVLEPQAALNARRRSNPVAIESGVNSITEAEKERIRRSYLRAADYGRRWLAKHCANAATRLRQQTYNRLAGALATCKKDAVGGMFWSAMPIANAINMSRDKIEFLAQLSAVRLLLERVIELDEGYYHASAHVAMGAMLGGVGKMGGGDANASKKHFDRALVLTGGRFLLVQQMMAETLMVQSQDGESFDALLGQIENFDLDDYPEQRLANALAKRKARQLAEQRSELFPE